MTIEASTWPSDGSLPDDLAPPQPAWTPSADPLPADEPDPSDPDASAPADPSPAPSESPPAAPEGPLLRTTLDGVPLQQILLDRPDVLRAYFEGFYGSANDRNSSAWADRVGGTTAEDYANYWYNRYGKLEGYAPHPDALGGGAAAAPQDGPPAGDRFNAQGVDLDQILRDRPDVYRAFYDEFYGAHNDRHSSAWADRVGGNTAQDYADYWYRTYGRAEGYEPTLAPQSAATAEASDDAPALPVNTMFDLSTLFTS